MSGSDAMTVIAGYTLASSDDGGFSVTVCQDQAGIEESVHPPPWPDELIQRSCRQNDFGKANPGYPQ